MSGPSSGGSVADTPRLLLDLARLEANAARMRARAEALGVSFRPHFKTAKSVEVHRVAHGGAPGPATVSTMKEAEVLAASGQATDILLAATAVPARLPRAEALARKHGTRLILVVDSPEMAGLLDADAEAPHEVLVEVDSGEHRAGVPPEKALAVARAIHGSRKLKIAGVMTHGGHSYGSADHASIADVAEQERVATVSAASAIRGAGMEAPIVSVGSSPTLLHARNLEGVTEIRAGVGLFWDLAQMSRGQCGWDDLALSVLSTVIGHNRASMSLVLDAGALALSKDVTANAFAPGTAYGTLGEAETGAALPLHVLHAYQEHGMVPVPDESWFERLPVGSLVRVYPNHACLTAAGGYGTYDVLDGAGNAVARWPRIDGWH
ncbi:alanine racemase [Roseomonas populi]|uniref:Alanine racemase n=1 Tax=Roseomonas populi TaxID=3121582 RepID=A0ABT1XAF4_9PROT|nr:alanine racemase [Roseomonas pecuniae]MCR0984736.1 alanine racemase [Roseomonas pecuniae]